MKEEEKTLHQKLVEIQGEIGFIEFDAKNQSMGYGYASAAGMIRKLNRALTARGLTARAVREDIQYHPGDGVAISTLVVAFSDGQTEVQAVGCGSGKDKGDKAVMKASTAAFKYALAHALALGWGAEDPEADEGTDKPSGETKPKGKPGRKPKAKPAEEPVLAGPIDVEATKKAIAEMTAKNARDIQTSIIAAKGTLPEIVYDSLAKAWKTKRDELRAAA